MLGSDFNSSRPSDGEFTRHPTSAQLATVIRDIKSRLKEFVVRHFDAETADLYDSTVPSSALKSLSPSPAGTGRKMVVNRKGQVTRLYQDVVIDAPRVFRACFFGGQASYGTQDTPTGPVPLVGEVTAGPGDQYLTWPSAYSASALGGPMTKYLFVVPDGVTRMKAFLTGGSPAYSQDKTVTRWTTIPCDPGQVFRIWVNHGPNAPCRIASYGNEAYVDNTEVDFNPPGLSQLSDSAPFLAWGGNAGNPGLVFLEWYA